MWLGRLLDWQGQARVALYTAAALSLVATLLHVSVIPAHLGEWWGYGAFFLVLTLSQGFYGLVLLCWHRRPVLLIGIAELLDGGFDGGSCESSRNSQIT